MEVAMEVIEEFQTQAGKLHQECERLRAENNRLEDENENLRTELSGLMKRVDELNSQIEELPTATLEATEPEITIQSIRAAIQQAYQDAAHDDCKGDQILHMVWGFEYLLQRLGVE
jgi:predicted nuclease with TOPRIM domain